MGRFLLVYIIKLAAPEVDPDEVVKKVREVVPDNIEMKEGTKVVPLFFGIKGIEAQFILPEEEGLQEKLEDILRSVEGVSEVEVKFTTRL